MHPAVVLRLFLLNLLLVVSNPTRVCGLGVFLVNSYCVFNRWCCDDNLDRFVAGDVCTR